MMKLWSFVILRGNAIDELNYCPNYLGRNLRSNNSKTLAVFIPDILNPFHAEVLAGAEREATEHGFRIMTFNTEDSPVKEVDLVQMAISYHVDGFITTSSLFESSSREYLAQYQKPCVYVQRTAREANAYFVFADDSLGMQMAVDHLVALGHTRIAHIKGTTNTSSALQRANAFCQSMKKHNLYPPSEYLVEGDYKLDAGYSAMGRLLSLPQPPTAVVCCNDLAAIGAINAVTSCGMHVPEDISIVGFDDIWMAAQMHPSLTTVCISAPKLGSLAAHTIIRLLEGSAPEDRTIITTPHLIIRDSTAICKAE